MNLGPVPNRAAVYTALGAFLTAILPPGTPIMRGQDNRVPEPSAQDFVIFTEFMQNRLATNVDTYADVAFTGSISGTTLTVTVVEYGSILNGSTLFGVGVAPGTLIQAPIAASGGVGTYVLSTAQTLSATLLAAGNELITQAVDISFQLDVHGPNSADNAQTISTLFRDDYATYWWRENGFLTSAPLYADDPAQMPFWNDQSQIETRWVINARIQANQVITSPQQFADQLKATPINAYNYPA